MPGSVIGMDGETQAGRSLPGIGGDVDGIEPVASPGDGGNASGPSASGPSGERGGIEPASCGIVGAQEPRRVHEGAGASFGPTSGESGTQAGGVAGGCNGEEGLKIFGEIWDGADATEAQEEEG
jgi:hypothetical protein